MKKSILIALMVLCFMIIPNVSADCTYQEQANYKKEASNIKINYETVTKEEKAYGADSNEIEVVKYDVFKVNILNLSENFYIKYSNNVNSDNKTYYFSNGINGIISFEWTDLSKVTTMTFRIYSSSKTGCKDELYRTMYLTLPRFNDYSSWGYCDGHEDSSVCEKYVTYNELTYEQFIERLNADNKDSSVKNTTNINSNTTNKVTNNYYKYIGIGAAVIIIVGILIVVFNRKRNKK